MSEVEKLRQLVASLTPGNVRKSVYSDIESALAACWEKLGGFTDGGMTRDKLSSRIETVRWEPPVLSFMIERHGALVVGRSSRAELQTWYVDTNELKASLGQSSYRQMRPMDNPFDTHAATQELTDIIHQKSVGDPQIKWLDDSTIKIVTAAVVPETNNRTTSARRKRLIIALAAKLERDGWRQKANQSVFVRNKG